MAVPQGLTEGELPRKKQPRDVRKARELRTQMSLPEVLLWRHLRKEPEGIKFRRQHPIGDYVLDFFCPSAKLCVEIDGEAHSRGNRPERDKARDAWLIAEGIEVLRIPATEVLRSPEDVADAVVRYCKR